MNYFSPLQTPKGRQAFREENQRKIDALTLRLAEPALSPEERAEIEAEIAKLRETHLGFNPQDAKKGG